MYYYLYTYEYFLLSPFSFPPLFLPLYSFKVFISRLTLSFNFAFSFCIKIRIKAYYLNQKIRYIFFVWCIIPYSPAKNIFSIQYKFDDDNNFVKKIKQKKSSSYQFIDCRYINLHSDIFNIFKP